MGRVTEGDYSYQFRDTLALFFTTLSMVYRRLLFLARPRSRLIDLYPAGSGLLPLSLNETIRGTKFVLVGQLGAIFGENLQIRILGMF